MVTKKDYNHLIDRYVEMKLYDGTYVCGHITDIRDREIIIWDKLWIPWQSIVMIAEAVEPERQPSRWERFGRYTKSVKTRLWKNTH